MGAQVELTPEDKMGEDFYFPFCHVLAGIFNFIFSLRMKPGFIILYFLHLLRVPTGKNRHNLILTIQTATWFNLS